MISGKRVPAPRTLIQKYPELRKFAEDAEDDENPVQGGQPMRLLG